MGCRHSKSRRKCQNTIKNSDEEKNENDLSIKQKEQIESEKAIVKIEADNFDKKNIVIQSEKLDRESDEFTSNKKIVSSSISSETIDISIETDYLNNNIHSANDKNFISLSKPTKSKNVVFQKNSNDNIVNTSSIESPENNGFLMLSSSLINFSINDQIKDNNEAQLMNCSYFFELWLDFLHNIINDIFQHIKMECIVQAHLLLELILNDLKEFQNAFSKNSLFQSPNQTNDSCISTSFESLPLLSAFVLSDQEMYSYQLRNLLIKFVEICNDEEITKFKKQIEVLTNRLLCDKICHFKERWVFFSALVHKFSLEDRFNFDIILYKLISASTLKAWFEFTEKFKWIAPIFNCLRIFKSSLRKNSIKNDLKRSYTQVDLFDKRNESIDKFKRSNTIVKKSLINLKNFFSFSYLRKNSKNLNKAWKYENIRGMSIGFKLDNDCNIHYKIKTKFAVEFIKIVFILEDWKSYHKWVPFCNNVECLKVFNTCSYLFRYIAEMPWPIKKRETLFICNGIDLIDELEQILVVINNTDAESFNDFFIPRPNPKIPRIPEFSMIFAMIPVDINITALEINVVVNVGLSHRLIQPILPWITRNTVVDFLKNFIQVTKQIDLEQIQKDKKFFYDNLNRRVQKKLIKNLKTENKETKSQCFEDEAWYRDAEVFS